MGLFGKGSRSGGKKKTAVRWRDPDPRGGGERERNGRSGEEEGDGAYYQGYFDITRRRERDPDLEGRRRLLFDPDPAIKGSRSAGKKKTSVRWRDPDLRGGGERERNGIEEGDGAYYKGYFDITRRRERDPDLAIKGSRSGGKKKTAVRSRSRDKGIQICREDEDLCSMEGPRCETRRRKREKRQIWRRRGRRRILPGVLRHHQTARKGSRSGGKKTAVRWRDPDLRGGGEREKRQIWRRRRRRRILPGVLRHHQMARSPTIKDTDIA